MMTNIPRVITSVLLCIGLLVSVSTKAASINIVAVESGGDVVITASGSINLTGLGAPMNALTKIAYLLTLRN